MPTYSNSNVLMTTTTFLFVALFFITLHSIEAQLGVCYGNIGDNLPSSQDVVNLYKSKNIGFMRIYTADLSTLQALQGSNIKLLMGVPNEQVETFASDPSQETQWVQTNVVPFASNIRYIVVGNKIEQARKQFIGPAMQNVRNALAAVSLGGQIKVSTAINSAFIKNSYPPSSREFDDMSFMSYIITFHKQNGSPLLVNVYPYFSYIGAQKDIQLDYALFTSPTIVVTDPNNGLKYQNLFDASVDAVYAALDKADGSNIPIIVSESGWPSDGGEAASIDNAGTYYKNLISDVNNGTPKKPGPIETYLFAMFDEDQKPGAPSEQHFGLFTHDQQPKYNLVF